MEPTPSAPVREPAPTPAWRALERCGCCGAGDARPAGSAQGVAIVRCGGCGVRRFDSVAPPAHVYRDGYHDGTGEFGWNYADPRQGDYDRALAHRRLAWLERSAGVGRIVDVGGGLGHFAAVAADRGWEADLLEPVPAAAAAAEAAGISTIVAGVERLGSLRAGYDAVAFVHSLEHFPAALEVLLDARRALRPGGHVFIEVPNLGSLARRGQGDRWNGWQAGEHVYLFHRRGLRRLLNRAGFDVVASRTFVPGWSGLQPEGYAHMVGLQPALEKVVELKRSVDPRRGDPAGPLPPPPAPIATQHGWRGRVFATGFGALAAVEQALGLGTNLQFVARSPGRP